MSIEEYRNIGTNQFPGHHSNQRKQQTKTSIKNINSKIILDYNSASILKQKKKGLLFIFGAHERKHKH